MKDINVLAIVKGNEQRFIFLYNDEHVDELLKVIGGYAERDDLDFTWFDAAVLYQKLRLVSIRKD